MRNDSTRYFSIFAVAIICLFMSLGCSKTSLHKRPFDVKTKTAYRISPTTPVPLEINGSSFTAFAHFAGGGTGKASLLGDCTIFFYQLVYSTGPEATPAGSVPAPVV
jgi:hypothetical protein